MTLREQATAIATKVQAEEIAEGFDDAKLYAWTGRTFTTPENVTFFEFVTPGSWDGKSWVADVDYMGSLLTLETIDLQGYAKAGL